MVPATFDLSERALASLESLASERGASKSDLLEQAILELKFKQALSPEEWRARIHELQASIAGRGVSGTPEEIEADIDAATDEVWAERRAARRR